MRGLSKLNISHPRLIVKTFIVTTSESKKKLHFENWEFISKGPTCLLYPLPSQRMVNNLYRVDKSILCIFF